MPTAGVTKARYYTDSAAGSTLLVDEIRIYNEAAYIGAAPQPVYDPRDYGAIGDGKANDHDAIQKAIELAAKAGGSVVLHDGTFLSTTLELRSKMTFFIAPSA